LNGYLRELFGGKTIKIALDAGLTCPNRDGTAGKGGCIFCGGQGSGEFTFSHIKSITEQFSLYRESIRKKWPTARYIAYFQSFSNTYGDIDYLRRIYYEAMSMEGVCALSIATRPDCLNDSVIELLREVKDKTYLFVELGFQTSNENTAKLINRCYKNDVYEEAVRKLKSIGANVITHVILGLPHENMSDMQNTVKYAVNCGTDGIKLHELFVLYKTVLADMYASGEFETLLFDEYVDTVVNCLEIIPEHIVIHRLTGDAPRGEIVAPLYSIKKFHILNAVDTELLRRDTWQGKRFLKPFV
ncbi:MAG: TIGR01212 family radical SAM protein, partial [Clostridiales bacterium]|nr:TIGR01212 family radical SAM protein [Clostridiales bacterium]